MSTSQTLMALFSTNMRPMGMDAKPQLPLPTEDRDAFAALLGTQLPEQLESAISEMSQEQLASLEQATLAVGGNNLPVELQDWLQQLPGEPSTDENALAVIGQWMQLLQQESVRPGTTAEASVERAAEPLMAGLSREGNARGQSATMPMGEGKTTDTLESGLLKHETIGKEPGRGQAVENGRLNLANAVQQGNQTGTQPGNPMAGQPVQNTQQDFSAMLQRAAGESNPGAAALFSKLVEQMDRARTGKSEESNALDGINRLGIQTSASAGALTMRPVAAAMQPDGVPFGHQDWNKGLVERVMWMSSQNLRSVEIQLDPAELGPLEIHIQQRGQELQVQFVSQNPSVREALEGQMHRLREMFVGQGLDQTDVTVADRNPGEQPRQGEGQLAEHTPAQNSASNGQREAEDSDEVALHDQPLMQPLRGLVDYYV